MRWILYTLSFLYIFFLKKKLSSSSFFFFFQLFSHIYTSHRNHTQPQHTYLTT